MARQCPPPSRGLLAGGVQPMQAEEEGRVVASVVYTGEVYNFMELRDELKRLGHHFKISSDTELVLSLNVWLRLAPIGSKMGPDPPRSPCPRIL